MTGVVGPIGEARQLVAGLSTETAIDITWTLNGHEVYLNLVDRCAWTSDSYAEWLGHTLVSLLLPNR